MPDLSAGLWFFLFVDFWVAPLLGGMWLTLTVLLLNEVFWLGRSRRERVRKYVGILFGAGVGVTVASNLLWYTVPGMEFVNHSPVWVLVGIEGYAFLLCYRCLPMILDRRHVPSERRDETTRKVILFLLSLGLLTLVIGFPFSLHAMDSAQGYRWELLSTMALALSPIWVLLTLGGIVGLFLNPRSSSSEDMAVCMCKHLLRWGGALAAVGGIISAILLWTSPVLRYGR